MTDKKVYKVTAVVEISESDVVYEEMKIHWNLDSNDAHCRALNIISNGFSVQKDDKTILYPAHRVREVHIDSY